MCKCVCVYTHARRHARTQECVHAEKGHLSGESEGLVLHTLGGIGGEMLLADGHQPLQSLEITDRGLGYGQHSTSQIIAARHHTNTHADTHTYIHAHTHNRMRNKTNT